MSKRALLVTRLSILTDETTSPERQAHVTAQAASIRGYSVAGVAEDLDVSASQKGPFERPELGDWLNNRADEFDVIIFWRLDRLVRKVSDLADMIQWCEANGKNLVSATEPFDLSTPMGKAMAYLIGVFAEMEATAISTRVSDAHKALREQGRWGGGAKPFWLKAVKRGKGVYLEHDTDKANEVRRAVELRLKKMSFGRIAKELGGDWNAGMVRRHLRSTWLLGHREHEGNVIRDSSAMPVQFAEPLVTQDEWKQLQSGKPAITRIDESYLLRGLVKCASCGRNMTRHVVKRARATYSNYRCMTKPHLQVQCGNRAVAEMEALDATATDVFMHEMGGVEITQPVFVPGADHSAELQQVRDAIEGVREEADAGLYANDRAGYLDRLRRLQEREAKLAALPHQPDRWENVGTGKTYAEEWEALSVEDRNQLLSDLDMTVTVLRVDEWPRDLPDPEPGFTEVRQAIVGRRTPTFVIVSWRRLE